MAGWLPSLIAVTGLLVLAPACAWLGRRYGSRAKGGLMLACVLLGAGAVMDPPAKHIIESTERKKGSPDNGEPPLPED
jgi:hypothetical protein